VNNSLSHIAFIMDGNNRWSKKRNKTEFESYKIGAEKLIDLSKYLFDHFNTKTISAFALSNNNTKRSKDLINTLKKVLEFFLDSNLEKNHNFSIKFKGDLDFFSKNILDKIFEIEKKTAKNNQCLLIFLNYSGQLDILRAAQKYNFKSLNKNKFQKLLTTHSFNNPDILIRTGGYHRLSDFFLYQISFTELFFLKKLWPDLNTRDLDKIINKYNSIERKFGY